MRAPIAALLCLCLTGTVACDVCANNIVRTLPSPDRSHTAVLFERDCGATTDYSTIAIVPAGAKQHKADDIWIADSNHGRVPVDSEGVLAIDLRWKSDSELDVGYPAQARVLLKAPSHLGVKIAYQEK